MYQRHWCSVCPRGPAKAESTANTESVRMVCGITHEYDAGDCGAGNACSCGGYMWGTYGDRSPGYEEFDGLLCFAEEIAG